VSSFFQRCVKDGTNLTCERPEYAGFYGRGRLCTIPPINKQTSSEAAPQTGEI
jgi:hypothetical protein